MKYINQIVYVDNAHDYNHAAFCNGHYGIITRLKNQIVYHTDFDYLLNFIDQSIFNHGREYWCFMEDEISGNFVDGIKGD